MKRQSIFVRILIPLLLLGILQSLLVGSAVLMGGTVQLLKSNSQRILGQNLQNRQIPLENEMVQRWSNVDECVQAVSKKTSLFLKEKQMTLAQLQKTKAAEELYLSLSEDLLYALRKNSLTGSFVIFKNGEEDHYPEQPLSFQGLYFRDLDAKSTPTDYSDILMQRGSAAVASEKNISLDSFWERDFSFQPSPNEKMNMDYYFKPFIAAQKYPGLHYRNLGRWSEPFLLNGDSNMDSEWVITYSVPLINESGNPYGVLGFEISVDTFLERIPSREIDAFGRGGYMLVSYDATQSKTKFDVTPQVTSGNAVKHLIATEGKFSLEYEESSGLFRLPEGSETGDTLYAGLINLDLYNTNAPFSNEQWALVALISENALYGIAENLERNVFFATIGSLLIGVICIYLVAVRTTRPLTSAADFLRAFGPEKLSSATTNVREIDELFQAIQDLNRKQKAVEDDLKNERERYLLALESTTDIILEYDCLNDALLIYHLEKSGGESHVLTHKYCHIRSDICEGQIVHPDDKQLLLGFLDGIYEDVTVRCQSSLGSTEYRWFSAKGKAVYNDEGKHERIIGSTRDVTAEKEAERLETEAQKRDQLTGLLKRTEGENAIRHQIAQKSTGCVALLDLDDFERLNEQYGMLYCDLLLEAISTTLKKCLEPDDIIARYGGDKFLMFLANANSLQVTQVGCSVCERVSLLNNSAIGGECVSCSIGFALVKSDYETALQQACMAMEYAKAYHRGKTIFYDDIEVEEGSGWELTLPKRQRNETIASIYYRYDENMISLAFNLFEKNSDVNVVVPMLLAKLARHYELHRIVVLGADLDFSASRVDYQWSEFGISRFDTKPEHYSKEAFQLLLQYYQDEGVLFAENLSNECKQMLKGNDAISTLCCPMYDNGRYTGSVIFQSPRTYWEDDSLEVFKEIVRLLSAHISKTKADLASRAKSEFLSRMSHEIRTPMNAIMGMTNIALCLPELPNKAKDCLGKIDASARYLLSIINDILDMSKIESGKMTLAIQEFDLQLLLSSLDTLMRPQAEDRELCLQFDINVKHNFLLGDALRLNQVLVNLLSNAIKFTKAAGSIFVLAEEIAHTEGSATMRFSVRDTGIGIDSQHVMRIFNAFEQEETTTAARYGGTGLGLSISSSLVRMMGGKLEVDTALGKGSDFYFTVVLQIGEKDHLKPEIGTTPKVRRSLAGCRVLLVEDNELNIEIAREILQMGGMEVVEAHDGQEAVDIFSRSSENAFELILMDIRMPVMGGLEATRTIRKMEREDAKNVPIIAMTANAFDDDMRKSIESGMNGHLAKPFEIDKLMEMMEELLRD